VMSSSLVGESDAPANPPNLSAQIESLQGIRQRNHRIVLGDLDILVDMEERVRSLEIRTNPRRWGVASLPSLPDALDAVFLRLLVSYDTNGIAIYNVPITVTCDPSLNEVRFAFGEYVSSRWFSAADGLVIGTTLDDYLSELRFSGVGLPPFA
jgi:hypothetical protein